MADNNNTDADICDFKLYSPWRGATVHGYDRFFFPAIMAQATAYRPTVLNFCLHKWWPSVIDDSLSTGIFLEIYFNNIHHTYTVHTIHIVEEKNMNDQSIDNAGH